MALGAAITRQTGDLTIVGIADGTIPFSFFTMPYEVSIQTTYWGSRPELIEVLDLASRGLIAPHCTTFPLSEAVHAYELLARGEVSGRAVIVP